MTLVEAIPAPPKPIAESEDGITKVMTFVDAETGADRVISGMNDLVLDGEGLELAEDGGDGVTGVKFFGPGLEDYLDLTTGARNEGSKLITGVGSYVETCRRRAVPAGVRWRRRRNRVGSEVRGSRSPSGRAASGP